MTNDVTTSFLCVEKSENLYRSPFLTYLLLKNSQKNEQNSKKSRKLKGERKRRLLLHPKQKIVKFNHDQKFFYFELIFRDKIEFGRIFNFKSEGEIIE